MTRINLEANVPEEEMEELHNNLVIGELREEYTSTGKFSKLKIFLEHRGLNEEKVISDKEPDILETKIQNQIERWHKKWMQIVEKQKKAELEQEKEGDAQRLTEEAEQLQEDIKNILQHTLGIDDAVDWEEIKNKKFFVKNYKSLPEYIKVNEYGKPIQCIEKKFSPKPQKSEFEPKITLKDKLFGAKKKKLRLAEDEYNKAVNKYNQTITQIKKDNEKRKSEFDKLVDEWNEEKSRFEEKQRKQNEKVEHLKNFYFNKDSEAIIEYCEIVLNNSQYPDFVPKNFELEYKEDSKLLLVEFFLPTPENLPTLKSVKHIKKYNELREQHLTEKQRDKLYDETIYRIALRTLHELFEADVVDAIDAINFNGLVRTIDASTGQRVTNCILSIYVNKSEFEAIDLAHIDPKQCFKSLKGVGSSKMSSLVPIKPIQQIDKHDDRFVEHYNIAEGLDKSSNLAAIDWQDFEHLIRELFEHEFKSSGGEVKITQASSDRGVDGIAFDPDPIRGGKIVIQAKRYTNVVGVDAVRDLYGTVLNEGATKGILVTTSDYGKEAYNFAKDKPLTLLNGSNLLHLFEKQGKRFRIDVKEAKELNQG